MTSVQERPPLELVVFPKIRGGYLVPLHVWSPASCDQGDHFKVTVSENDVHRRIESKRLSDAEMSAEILSAVFHESECEVRGLRLILKDPGNAAIDHYAKHNHEFGRQADILNRFAAHDHHDEVPE